MSIATLFAIATVVVVGDVVASTNRPDEFSSFDVSGCSQSGVDRLDCTPESAVGQAGCDRLFRNKALAGFGLPAAICYKFEFPPKPPPEYIRRPESPMPIYVRLLLATEGGFTLVPNGTALRQRFAPVESNEEALAFAVLVTGFVVEDSEFVPPAGYRVFLKYIPPTSIERSEDGFVVRRLRDYRGFGCGPHPTDLVDVAVSRDGFVSVAGRTHAYENPAEDALCID